MVKQKAQFVCQSCGNVTSKWAGRCDGCGEWNSIIEEQVNSGVGSGPKTVTASGRPIELVSLTGATDDAQRITTGISELDRVTGGGFVVGSASLVGGDPGIGKSTLLLQAAAALAAKGLNVVYISGEEASRRCGCGPAALALRIRPCNWPARPTSKPFWPRLNPQASQTGDPRFYSNAVDRSY